MKSEMSEMHIISMRIFIQLIDSILELIHGNGSCKLQHSLSDRYHIHFGRFVYMCFISLEQQHQTPIQKCIERRELTH